MSVNKLPLVPGRTTPGFGFSLLERAILDCMGERQFGKPEIEKVVAFFRADPPECAFCGSLDIARWDHLVPVNSGGGTVIGNMVLACARCDDSKQHLPYEQWMLSSAQWSPLSRGVVDVEQRLERIREYVRHYNYQPPPLSERLTSEEQERLELIRAKLTEARIDLEALIKDYRTRTGYK